MGKVLAEALDGELDVVLVHKLGAPYNPEYAIGAVCETGEIVLRQTPEVAGIPQTYIEAEAAVQLETLRRRRARYTPGRGSIDPAGRVVIIVDDGIATGATFKAALEMIRARRPRKLIAAAGVAPQSSLAEIRTLADEVVCLESPAWFFAVGEVFEDFRQVEDDEVAAILARAQEARVAEMAKP